MALLSSIIKLRPFGPFDINPYLVPRIFQLFAKMPTNVLSEIGFVESIMSSENQFQDIFGHPDC